MLMGVRVHPFDSTLPDTMRLNRVSTLNVSPLKMDALKEDLSISWLTMESRYSSCHRRK